MRLTCLILAALVVAGAASAGDVTVFAAASLREALDEIAASWAEASGNSAAISYAGSSELARQIEAGAPANVVVSANVDWMDALEDDGLIVADTRVDLLGNSLVLIASAGVPGIQPSQLPEALGDRKLAMALYDAVPAGIYGRQALTSAGVWDAIVGRVAQAPNVRAALALVATGEAPYGVVYATDAAAEPRVRVVASFSADSHPPISYPAAVTTDGDGSDARAFLDFLQGPMADAVFLRHGFALR